MRYIQASFQHTYTFAIIVLCVCATVAAGVYDGMYAYSMHGGFVEEGVWGGVILQFVLYQFLHGDMLHLLSNAIFLVLFGASLELLIGKRAYVVFCIFCTLVVGGSLIVLSPMTPTVGISGFTMAILAYMALELQRVKHPHASAAFVLLVLNIGVGLSERISLLGHASGAICGLVFWGSIYLLRKRPWKRYMRMRK